MSEAAQVTSVEALQDFRVSVCRFREDGIEALAAIEMEIRRTFDWLQDQLNYWTRMIRECEEEVIEAKAALSRKEIPNALGRIPDCTEEKVRLRKAKGRLEYAEEKVKTIRRWGPLWQHAVTEYEGTGRRLAGMLDGGLKQGLVVLDTKIGALEAYLRLNQPAPPPPAKGAS
jgi:hypothetical protein